MYAFVDRGSSNCPLVIRADGYEKKQWSDWWLFWVRVGDKRVMTAWVPRSAVKSILPLDAYQIPQLEGIELLPVKRGADGRFVKRDIKNE